jgi:hypothetical protein
MPLLSSKLNNMGALQKAKTFSVAIFGCSVAINTGLFFHNHTSI